MGFNNINKNRGEQARKSGMWDDISDEMKKDRDPKKFMREQFEKAGASENLMNSRPIQNLLANASKNIDSFNVAKDGKSVSVTEKTEIYDEDNAYQNSLDPTHARAGERRLRDTHDISVDDDGSAYEVRKTYQLERSITYDAMNQGQPSGDERDNIRMTYSVDDDELSYNPAGHVTHRRDIIRPKLDLSSRGDLRRFQGDSQFMGDGMNDADTLGWGQAKLLTPSTILDCEREGDSNKITATLLENKNGEWKKSRAEHVDEYDDGDHDLRSVGMSHVEFKPVK